MQLPLWYGTHFLSALGFKPNARFYEMYTQGKTANGLAVTSWI